MVDAQQDATTIEDHRGSTAGEVVAIDVPDLGGGAAVLGFGWWARRPRPELVIPCRTSGDNGLVNTTHILGCLSYI